MDVILYKNFSVENKIDKNITQVASYLGTQLVEPYDDFDISVKFTVANSLLKWSNINYMQVDGAYYFVDSVEHLANGVELVHGRMDLLMTYKNSIGTLKVLAERSSSHGSTRIEDASRLLSVDSARTVAVWPAKVLGSEVAGLYVLTTAQKGFTASA